jgi:hypothetical protein
MLFSDVQPHARPIHSTHIITDVAAFTTQRSAHKFTKRVAIHLITYLDPLCLTYENAHSITVVWN